MGPWKIRKLRSGGVITNYHCTSRCKHCLYNCHPKRDKSYLSPERALAIFNHIRRHGCYSVHIGGGEPMLKPDTLLEIMESADRSGISIDYAETNASWFSDLSGAMMLLKDLKRSGMNALLVSISPFHNEFVPLYKTKGVLEAARNVGLNIIPWIAEFIPILSQLNEKKTHVLDEFQPFLDRRVLDQIKSMYWIHFGGRSLNTYRPHMPLLSYKQVMDQRPRDCLIELTSTGHFHIDLNGRYIPGLCSGLAMDMTYLGKPLTIANHPILTRLAMGGIRSLAQWAEQRFAYRPGNRGFINKCDLCNEIRNHIAFHEEGPQFEELYPAEFYDKSQ